MQLDSVIRGYGILPGAIFVFPHWASFRLWWKESGSLRHTVGGHGGSGLGVFERSDCLVPCWEDEQ